MACRWAQKCRMIWYKCVSSQFNREGSVQLAAIVSSANVIIIGSFKDIIRHHTQQQYTQLLHSIASMLCFDFITTTLSGRDAYSLHCILLNNKVFGIAHFCGNKVNCFTIVRSHQISFPICLPKQQLKRVVLFISFGNFIVAYKSC